MTDQERLRIAVALAALRHKPADQSCASYVLELYQRFPTKPCKPDPCAIDASGPWRVRVQGLEQALRDLQDKYNAQRVDLAALQATRSLSIGDPDTTPSCPAPTPVPGKKKSRKKAAPGRVPQAKNTNEGSRVADMRGPWSNLLVPELSGSSKLLSSVEALDALLDTRRRRPSAVTIDACALAAGRVLDAVAATIDTLLPPATPSASTSGVIQGLSTLVTRFLLTTVPALSAPSESDTDAARPLDALFGNLVSSTLLPLLPAFHALSLAHLTALLRPDARAPHDARPDVLAFLRATLHTLADLARAPPGGALLLASAHAAVLRAGVRALETLCAPPPAPDGGGASRTPASPAARVERLARRDALWYLCAALHAAVPGAPAGEERQDAALALRAGVGAALAGLLWPRGLGGGGEGVAGEGPVGDRRVQCGVAGPGRGLLRGVEREMVLAVAEKVWLSQG